MSWKYVDIERIDHPEVQGILDFDADEIVIEEKMDGGNGCFFLEDGKLHVCSRNRVLTKEGDEKTFTKSRKYIEETVHDLNPDFYYYFEHMQKHTVNYGNGIIPAIGLDIKPKEGAFGKLPAFLGRDAKEKEFARIGLPLVKVKWRGTSKDLRGIEIAKFTEKSEYYDGYPEGVVIKNYGRVNEWGKQLFAKLVRDDFKEVNKAKFGGFKTDTSETVKLVETYVTEARIRKRIHALVNEQGKSLDRSLMQWLVVAVMEDVFKEETKGILKEFSIIHVGALKQKASKECLRVLDQEIFNAKKIEVIANG